MTTKIQINDEESIEISSELTGTEEGFSAPRQYNNVFSVTVTNGGIAETFDYHISTHDTQNGKKALTDEDHISAVLLLPWGCYTGSQSFEEFCDEWDMMRIPGRTEKIWKACQEATQKADNLSIGDLYQVSNYIQEKYPDAV